MIVICKGNQACDVYAHGLINHVLKHYMKDEVEGKTPADTVMLRWIREDMAGLNQTDVQVGRSGTRRGREQMDVSWTRAGGRLTGWQAATPESRGDTQVHTEVHEYQ